MIPSTSSVTSTSVRPSRSVRDRERVPHHLIDVLDPAEWSSAGDYQRRARAVLSEIRERGRVPVLRRWDGSLPSGSP